MPLNKTFWCTCFSPPRRKIWIHLRAELVVVFDYSCSAEYRSTELCSQGQWESLRIDIGQMTKVNNVKRALEDCSHADRCKTQILFIIIIILNVWKM